MPMRMEAHCRIYGHRHDLNMKGAYLHMLADTLVSVGVVVSGALIFLTRWQWLDPIIGHRGHIWSERQREEQSDTGIDGDSVGRSP